MKKQYASFQEYLDDNYQGPVMATDIIIRYDDGKKDGIVLIERKYPPFGLALPGGMAERMTFGENAIKESKEETGLEVVLDNPYQPLCVFSGVDQDPRAFIGSVTYTGVGSGELKPHKDEDAKSAEIYRDREIEDLLDRDVWAFSHHKKILRLYLDNRKEDSQYGR